jgi:hypothetical protein
MDCIVDAKLFVLIDEYDQFANDLIALGTLGDNVYRNMLEANGLVRDFYEKLKAYISYMSKNILQRSPLRPEIPYEWMWELKYLKKDDATDAQVATTLATARAQLEKYRASVLFAGRDDVKFAALLFIGKEQHQIVPLP